MTAPESRANVSALPLPYPTSPVARASVDADSATFDWTPVPAADRYRVQIAATDAFETIYYDQSVERPATISLSDVLPDRADEAYWRVRAEGVDEASWSRPARFEVGTADDGAGGRFLVNAAPVPVHPAHGGAVDGRAASFAWEGVPEASGYRLQIARDEAVDEPQLNLTFDRTTSITLFDMVPADADRFVWRVRALFPNDSEGPWSQWATFDVDEEGGGEEAETRATASAPDSAVAAAEGAPEAAGPARTGRTSRAMAIAFITVLVVSFVATVAVMMAVIN